MPNDSSRNEHQAQTESSTPVRSWSDWSVAGIDSRRREIRRTLQPMPSDPDSRSPQGASLDTRLQARELRLRLESLDYRLHEFPINQLMGVPNQTTDGLRIAFYLIARHPLDSIADANAMISLVEQSEGHLGELAGAVREGIDKGIVLPREAIAATKIAVQDTLRELPLHAIYHRFATGMSTLDGASAKKVADACRRMYAALEGPFRRGYTAIDAALGHMRVHSRESFGVWDLPDGQGYYRHCLERWSGTSESAESLHDLGRAEVSRIRGEIAAMTGAGLHGAASAAAEPGQDDDAFFPSSNAGAAAYIARAQELVDTVFARLDHLTTWRPRASLQIRAVEPARQNSALYAEFYPATPDGTGPSLYYINAGDMRRLPKAELAALTFHESVPGHHLQLCTTQERTDLAAFRRQPFLYESYCEGWAMYSEQLGCELLHDVLSSAERLGCLTRRLWMATRVAADTGIHARRWSRADAIRFFQCNSFASLPMIEQEVDRLSVWPGQATAYHVGYLAFSRLRDAVCGASRDPRLLRDFHDRLFQFGPVPVEMLGLAFE